MLRKPHATKMRKKCTWTNTPHSVTARRVNNQLKSSSLRSYSRPLRAPLSTKWTDVKTGVLSYSGRSPMPIGPEEESAVLIGRRQRCKYLKSRFVKMRPRRFLTVRAVNLAVFGFDGGSFWGHVPFGCFAEKDENCDSSRFWNGWFKSRREMAFFTWFSQLGWDRLDTYKTSIRIILNKVN